MNTESNKRVNQRLVPTAYTLRVSKLLSCGHHRSVRKGYMSHSGQRLMHTVSSKGMEAL